MKKNGRKPYGAVAMTAAEKQRAYRDRRRAIRDAPKIAAARQAAGIERLRQELAAAEREAAEQAARQAAEATKQAEAARVARGHY